MKKLTLDLWEKIVEAFYKKSLEHIKMVGHATKDEVANYLGFYGVNNSLYWSEQDGEIKGVSTAHPGMRDFDWNWSQENGIWTAHVIWADNVKAQKEMLKQFLQAKNPVVKLFAWRQNRATLLSAKKLERIFTYGRKQNNNHSGSTGSKLSGVHEEHPSGSGGDGSASLCAGGDLPAQIC